MQQTNEVVFIRTDEIQALIDILRDVGWTLEGTRSHRTRRFWRWSLPDGRLAELKVTGIIVGPGSDLLYCGDPDADQLYRVSVEWGDAWLLWHAEDHHDPADLRAEMRAIHELLLP